jgi:hypothetical protein
MWNYSVPFYPPSRSRKNKKWRARRLKKKLARQKMMEADKQVAPVPSPKEPKLIPPDDTELDKAMNELNMQDSDPAFEFK